MFNDNGPNTARQSAERAIYPGITDGELSALARSAETKVRAAVAAHAGTPLTTLLKLAQDPVAEVRIGVASNRRRGVPEQLHEDLAKDKEVDVVYELIANPTVSEALISKLGRHIHREYARIARARVAAVKAGKRWPPHEEEPAVEAAAEPASAAPAVPTFAAIEPVANRSAVVDVTRQRERESSSALDALLSD